MALLAKLDGYAGAAFRASSLQDVATARGAHSYQKAARTRLLSSIGLICSFHYASSVATADTAADDASDNSKLNITYRFYVLSIKMGRVIIRHRDKHLFHVLLLFLAGRAATPAKGTLFTSC